MGSFRFRAPGKIYFSDRLLAIPVCGKGISGESSFRLSLIFKSWRISVFGRLASELIPQ
jgi:hypothetical protein